MVDEPSSSQVLDSKLEGIDVEGIEKAVVMLEDRIRRKFRNRFHGEQDVAGHHLHP